MTFCCQCYFCVLNECRFKRKDFLFCCNCALVIEYWKLKVADCVCACRSQIECAAVLANDACDICSPTFLFGVEFLECGLLVFSERANRTRNADITCQFAEGEFIITIAGVLTAKRNTFDGDEQSLFCNQILIFQSFCRFENLSVIGRSLNGLAFKDFNGRTCNFVCSAVCIFRTCYTDKHTFFEFEVFNGICIELIRIITAVGVLQINCIIACAVLLGTECGDIAFDNDSLIIFGCNVLCPSEFSPFRDLAREPDRHRMVTIFDGRSQDVVDVTFRSFRNVNRNLSVCCNDFHTFGITAGYCYRPFDRIRTA